MPLELLEKLSFLPLGRIYLLLRISKFEFAGRVIVLAKNDSSVLDEFTCFTVISEVVLPVLLAASTLKTIVLSELEVKPTISDVPKLVINLL